MTGLEVRGVVEGFYGRPFGWEDRHRMVAFLGKCGANTYVYAPKNDPLHRDRWREPYLAHEWRPFGDLVEAGSTVGVDVWFGISPLGLRLSDAGDIEALVAKLAAADAAGLHRICLLVDDMPEDFASSADAERFPTLAAAHVELVRLVRDAVRSHGPDRELWFVPLHYHGDPEDDYVREVGEQIPSDVAIMWTGPEVCSEVLSLEHTQAVATSLRRPVLYWDNHPVNDGGMRHDPHLNPLTGRDPRLGPETLGLLANVAIQPEASLIAVGTAMRYAADPASYEPAAAWREALLAVTGDERDADAVETLADLARRSPLARGEKFANRLREPLRRVTEGWDDPSADRGVLLADIDTRLRDLVATADRLRSGLTNPRLRADLAPWAVKLQRQSLAAHQAVGLVAAWHAGGGPVQDAQLATVLDLLEEARSSFHWVAGDQLEVFARWCLRRLDGGAG